MATVDGQQLNIDRMDIDRYDEQSVQLSNGLIFRCKYDLCSNTTTSTLHAPDGDVLGSLQAPAAGNLVREYLEKVEDLLNSHEAIEDQLAKALAGSEMEGDALQRHAEYA